MSFLSEEELAAMGFAELGRNVKVSRKASLYGCGSIRIGDHSRIDDFCVLSSGSGGIRIGRHVHIAAMCALIGSERIEMADYSGLSSRVSIYSSSDDYSGASMTNPTVPGHLKKVDSRPVSIGAHAIIGSGSVVLPGSHIGTAAAVGALSLVRGKLDEFTIYSGVPVRMVKKRLDYLIHLAEELEPDQE